MLRWLNDRPDGGQPALIGSGRRVVGRSRQLRTSTYIAAPRDAMSSMRWAVCSVTALGRLDVGRRTDLPNSCRHPHRNLPLSYRIPTCAPNLPQSCEHPTTSVSAGQRPNNPFARPARQGPTRRISCSTAMIGRPWACVGSDHGGSRTGPPAPGSASATAAAAAEAFGLTRPPGRGIAPRPSQSHQARWSPRRGATAHGPLGPRDRLGGATEPREGGFGP
jgi:hypothetical protein